MHSHDSENGIEVVLHRGVGEIELFGDLLLEKYSPKTLLMNEKYYDYYFCCVNVWRVGVEFRRKGVKRRDKGGFALNSPSFSLCFAMEERE